MGFLFLLSFILPTGANRSRSQGSAHFIKNKMLRIGNAGLVIDGLKRLPLSASFRHALVVAPTGTGKTISFILPNILLQKHSMCITDVKGELYELTAPALRHKGYRVLCFDFNDIENSLLYNPLSKVRTDSDIYQLANTMYDMASNGGKEQAVWKQGAVNIIELVIRCLLHSQCVMPATIGSVIRLINQIDNGTPHMDTFIQTYAPDQETRERWQAFTGTTDRTRSGQLTTCRAALKIFDTQEIRAITADDTFNFQDLRRQPTAIFLKLPVAKATQVAPVVSLLYAQLFNHLLSTSLSPEDEPIFFYLEEFSNLRKLPDFDKVIALIRSQKCSLSLIVQNLDQIDAVYGKETANTLISNCASLVSFAGIREGRTLDYLTKIIGKTTVRQSDLKSGHSRTFGRDLLTADELRTLPADQAIFIYSSELPQRIYPLPLYKNKKLLKQSGLKSEDGRLVLIKQPALKNPDSQPLPSPSEEALELPPPMSGNERDIEPKRVENKEMEKRLDKLLGL